VDESTPTRRARPAGVLGAEVWVKLVDADQPAPTNPAALVFLTMTTKPTFRADFKPGEGGTKWGSRRLHGPLGQHAGREGAVVGDCDGDGGGMMPLRGYIARSETLMSALRARQVGWRGGKVVAARAADPNQRRAALPHSEPADERRQ